MKYLLVAIFALVTPILGRPQEPAAHAVPLAAHPHPHPGDGSTPATIVSQSENVGPDGSFNYSYQTSDGIKVEQTGSIKPNPEAKSVDPNNPDASADIQVVQGSYSYTAPDGQEISLKYVADDKGFQPEGAHLPTAPPVPSGIARSLEQHPEQAQAQATHPQAAVAQPVPQQTAGTTLNPSPSPQA